jgi:hypothetical protein
MIGRDAYGYLTRDIEKTTRYLNFEIHTLYSLFLHGIPLM